MRCFGGEDPTLWLERPMDLDDAAGEEFVFFVDKVQHCVKRLSLLTGKLSVVAGGNGRGSPAFSQGWIASKCLS